MDRAFSVWIEKLDNVVMLDSSCQWNSCFSDSAFSAAVSYSADDELERFVYNQHFSKIAFLTCNC